MAQKRGKSLDMATSIFWGERYASFLEPGQMTGRVLYSKYSECNLGMRTDLRLSDDTWLSVGYLNIVLHNGHSAILLSTEEWFILEDHLGKLGQLAKDGKKLSKLRNWQDYCLMVGEVVFAPSNRSGGVWIARKGMTMHLKKEDIFHIKAEHHRIKALAVMKRKLTMNVFSP